MTVSVVVIIHGDTVGGVFIDGAITIVVSEVSDFSGA